MEGGGSGDRGKGVRGECKVGRGRHVGNERKKERVEGRQRLKVRQKGITRERRDKGKKIDDRGKEGGSGEEREDRL